MLRPGSFAFAPGATVALADWHFALETGETFDSINSRACVRAQLLAALDFIARSHGIEIRPTCEALTLDSERQAIDAINVIRWMP